MPSLRLYLRAVNPPGAYRFTRPGGVAAAVPALRLSAYVRLLDLLTADPVARRLAFLTAPVDTGAQLSVIGQDLWRHFRPGVVTPLPFAPGTPAAHRSVAIGGGTYPFDLGELTLDLRDPDGGQLACRVVAKLLRDGGRFPLPLILGPRGGLFDGRRLNAEPDPAAPFGHRWEVGWP